MPKVIILFSRISRLELTKKPVTFFVGLTLTIPKKKKITPKGSIDQELEHSEFLYHQLQLSCSIKKHDAKTKQKTAVPNVNKQQQSGRKH